MGTGRIAAKVLPILASAPGCEVVAVASRERARAEGLVRQSGRVSGAPSRAACLYEELAGRGDVDAVYITLINSLHYEWCSRLLDAGKHVLCEKPLVATEAEARALAAIARRAGVLCTEGFMYMHHPQTDRLIELARAASDPGSPIGPLVRIRSIRNVHNTDEYILRTRLSHAMQGGALMDLGCYPVSIARLLAGCEPRAGTLRASVDWAAAAPGESRRVDESCAFSWTFESGVEFEGECSFTKGRAGIDILLELEGQKGSARTEYPFSPDPVRQVLTLNGREEVFVNPGDKFVHQFVRFAAAARGEAPPLPSIEFSIGQAATIEAIHRAIGLEY